MPEPAVVAVAEPQELTFETESHKVAALEALQNRDVELSPKDMAEIERIENAKVISPDLGEDDPGAAPAPAPQQAVAPVAAPAAATPPTAPAAAQPAAAAPTAEEKRQWTIDDALIAQFDEEYTDPGTGRVRKTITQKTPEDLLKSYTHAQRRVRYLESQALPDARNEGYTRAKTELGKQVESLQKQLDEAKKAQQVAAQQPTPATPAAPAQQASAPALIDTLKKLDGVADEDLVDHVPTMVAGLKGAVTALTESSARIQALEAKIQELRNTSTQVAVAEVPAAAPTAVAPEDETVQKWNNACKLMDGFAQSPECPPELRTGRSFNDMASEAMRFHRELAVHYSGKPASDITDADTSAAVAAYLKGTPQLVQRVQQAGLQEPETYRKWVELDAVDALRTGWIRDPVTQQWKQRYSPDNGKPVQFPDALSAYHEYQRLTGRDTAQVAKAVQDNSRQMLAAITQRDRGLVQMDVQGDRNKDGQIAVDQAMVRLEEINQNGGYDWVLREARRGNKELWNQYNGILVALGQERMSDKELAR